MTNTAPRPEKPPTGLARLAKPEIVVPIGSQNGVDLYLRQETVEKIKEYGEAALSESTRKNYATDWAHFCKWCKKNSLPFLPAPPGVVAGYIAERASNPAIPEEPPPAADEKPTRGRKHSPHGVSAATITGDLAAISYAHKRAGHVSPTLDPIVKDVIKGIRRKLKVAPVKKAPIAIGTLADFLDSFGQTPTGLRNRALLLLGFSGAFRRSEVVAIRFEHIEFVDRATVPGVALFMPSSKTDQEGRGDVITIEYGSKEKTCPVRALKNWLTVSGISSGPVFRAIKRNGALGDRPLCDKMVALLVKDLVQAAGLDKRAYAGHSLRSGYVTTSINSGTDIYVISRHCRHTGVATTMGYAQLNKEEMLKKHPTKKLGL